MTQTLRNIRHRVQDDTGASIIIALVFLLICATIAVIVVNFASVNSTQRDKDYQASNQAYYTLSSAAQASTDILSSSQGDLSSLSITFDSNWNVVSQTPANTANQLAKNILNAASKVKSTKTATAGTYDVTADSPYGSNESLDAVSVAYTMDSAFAITATASFKDATVAYGYDASSTKAATITQNGGNTTVTWK